MLRLMLKLKLMYSNTCLYETNHKHHPTENRLSKTGAALEVAYSGEVAGGGLEMRPAFSRSLA